MNDFVAPAEQRLTPPQGTPHLTINHEATVDLDSTNAFEGKPTYNISTVIETDLSQAQKNFSKSGLLHPPMLYLSQPPRMA